MPLSTKNIHALFIHGVGQQEAGYSSFAQHHLSAALDAQRAARAGAKLYGQEVLWAPVLDRYESAMLEEVRRRGSKNRPLQRLTIGTLADALCYQNSRDEILGLIDVAFARLRSDEVTIFAHSLGGLIACDWMRSRAHAKVEHFHTFGCNLQLFSLGGKFDCPLQVDKPGKWTSYFDPTDMLGWPIGGFQAQVRDIEVEVGGLLGDTGLAHLAYWNDSSFWSKDVPNAL